MASSKTKNKSKKPKKSLPWNTVERQIRKEAEWLRGAIDTFGEKEKVGLLGIPGIHYCRECLLRKLALLIVSGGVKAKEIRKKEPLKSFWKSKKQPQKGISHGSDWHRETMAQIENDFIRAGYEVVREPDLSWGRADLGVYKEGKPPILVEVGTTSLSKLWFNLVMRTDFVYLTVPNDEKLIEFTRSKEKLLPHDLLNF